MKKETIQNIQYMIEELKNEETLTVKREKEILNIIYERLDYIWRDLCKTTGVDLGWYSLSNDTDTYNNDGNGTDGGIFDPILYNDTIDLIGNWFPRKNLGRFADGFPTYFLYTINYKKEFLKCINEDMSLKVNITKKEIINKLSKLPVKELKNIWRIYFEKRES